MPTKVKMLSYDYGHLCESLKSKLQDSSGLPGRAAQARFAPALSYGRHFGPKKWNARNAAVLVLLVPDAMGNWTVPYTVRNKDLRDHAGQISFPGGVSEGNESSQQTALREYSEELGGSTENVEVLGALTPLYLFNTNFWVEPWIAVCPEPLVIKPNLEEVADCFNMPVDQLLNDENYTLMPLKRGAFECTVRCIRWNGYEIWGATSMITAELIDLLRNI